MVASRKGNLESENMENISFEVYINHKKWLIMGIYNAHNRFLLKYTRWSAIVHRFKMADIESGSNIVNLQHVFCTFNVWLLLQIVILIIVEKKWIGIIFHLFTTVCKYGVSTLQYTLQNMVEIPSKLIYHLPLSSLNLVSSCIVKSRP
jgi:hypothetical protein